jgi:phosphatidylglycerophosphate synthase
MHGTERLIWATWANLLTAIRLLVIPLAVWAIVGQRWTMAAGLFVLAVITDLADGPVARRFRHASPFGGLFDHATDALFVTTTLGALAWLGLVNDWLPWLVLAAFLQYTADSRALAGAVLRTSFLGRANGIAYFVMVGIPVIRNALGWGWPPDAWIAVAAWVLVISTLASMLDRGLALARQSGRRRV